MQLYTTIQDYNTLLKIDTNTNDKVGGPIKYKMLQNVGPCCRPHSG